MISVFIYLFSRFRHRFTEFFRQWYKESFLFVKGLLSVSFSFLNRKLSGFGIVAYPAVAIVLISFYLAWISLPIYTIFRIAKEMFMYYAG